MPLQFESISHGPIAFGFFNIETDMILLNQYFLFANDFCHHIIHSSENDKETYEAPWEVYPIEKGAEIGNLIGTSMGLTTAVLLEKSIRSSLSPEKHLSRTLRVLKIEPSSKK